VPKAPAFRLGDRVRVRVDALDRDRKQIRFSVLPLDERTD
jgi:exoribonuclease R